MGRNERADEIFEEEILKRNIKIQKRTQVTKLLKEKDHLILLTNKGEKIETQKVIFNLTHWALESILPDEEKQKIKDEVEDRKEGQRLFVCILL